MNTKFATILASLRAHNGMAIDSHNGREVKLEAIAMFGDKDVVAMYADQPYYSLNGMFINSEGRACVSSYAWSTMGPEIIQDTAIASAEEYNKPEHHTPGMSYHLLNNVTNIIEEEKTMNTNNIVATSLGLTFSADNPVPGAKEMNSLLYTSADNKMFLNITPLESAEIGVEVLDTIISGVEIVNKMGVFKMEAQTEKDKPLAVAGDHPAYMAMLASVPDIAAISTMVMKTPFLSKGLTGDAVSIIAIAGDGTMYTVTIFTAPEEISKELAWSFLDNSFLMEHVGNNVEALVNTIMEDPSIGEECIAFQNNEVLGKISTAVMREHGEAFREQVERVVSMH